jgi:LysR family transcriptional regulator, regulator for genes of the gallate degradation pathway
LRHGASYQHRNRLKPSYPNLRNLVRMLRVIDAGGLTAVANAVGRSQQTISHSISSLEQELGVQLFERTPQGTFPTPHAVIVGQRVRNALRHLSEAQEDFLEHSDSGKAAGLRICELNVSNQEVLVFVAMCQQHDVRRVAKHLKVNAAAVRRAIASLEAQAGMALFERIRCGSLVPSQLAEILARQMRRALWEIRAAMAELRSAEGAIEGEVVFGAGPRVHSTLLPRIISHLRGKHPALRLTHRVDSYESLERALSNREVDFIVGTQRGDSVPAGIAVYPLLKERVRILARADHPLHNAPYPDLRRYLECQWILPPPCIPMRRRFRECLRKQDLLEPAVIFESGDYELARGVLLRTDTIALALRCQAVHDIEQGALCFLPHPEALAPLLDSAVTLHLMYPAGIRRSPSAQVFFDATTQVAAELQAELDTAGASGANALWQARAVRALTG